MKHPESTIQQTIVNYLSAMGFWPVAVPNGAVVAGDVRRRAMRVGILKREGMCPGFPDLIVYGPAGRVGHIEVKNEGAYQRPEQKGCQARLADFGHRYAVCRSIADVDETLVRWGWV